MEDNYVEMVNYDIKTHTDDDSESGKDSEYFEMYYRHSLYHLPYKSGYNIGIYHGFFFWFYCGYSE